MNYPENFLRGISDKALIAPNGDISSAVFYFDPQHITDDWMVQSICWEDNNSVISLMMCQKNKEGNIQFKAGVVRVPRGSISYINKLPMFRGLLSYERKRLEDNPYHGNLLLKKDTLKGKRKIVAALIVAHVSQVLPQQ